MTSTLKASSILPSRGSQCNFILKLEVPSETNLGDDLSRALGASCKGMDQGKYTDDCIQPEKNDVERKGNCFFLELLKENESFVHGNYC